MTLSDHEKNTREVFHEIHQTHLQDGTAARRVRGLLTCENMKLPADYFTGKVCADLGCGSTAAGALNLLDIGAAHVHALDLDDSFLPTAGKALSEYPGRWNLHVGSVTRLPFDDAAFDFILCQGVIHHVEDDGAAIREIARCLKPGGMANLMVHGGGGFMTAGTLWLREAYRTRKDIRSVFDQMFQGEITPADLIEWLSSRADPRIQPLLAAAADMMNKDLILTIQDRIKAPSYRMYEESDFRDMLRAAGFTDMYRVTRKPAFSNIRMALAPLYDEYDSPLARLMYGEGMITIMARK